MSDEVSEYPISFDRLNEAITALAVHRLSCGFCLHGENCTERQSLLREQESAINEIKRCIVSVGGMAADAGLLAGNDDGTDPAPVIAPAECVRCGSQTGPLTQEESPGWLCRECYEDLQFDEESRADGMNKISLRDYRATHILAGMLANPQLVGLVGNQVPRVYRLDDGECRMALCHRAYLIADDMAKAAEILAERPELAALSPAPAADG